jgi:hypothetical protein
MIIRRELGPTLLAGTAFKLLLVLALMGYCLALDMKTVHLAVLAVLTTTGPLIARVFVGTVRRRQRVLGLEMNCLEADDEVLVARTAPLAMPVIGTLFAWFGVM